MPGKWFQSFAANPWARYWYRCQPIRRVAGASLLVLACYNSRLKDSFSLNTQGLRGLAFSAGAINRDVHLAATKVGWIVVLTTPAKQAAGGVLHRSR